MKRRYVVTVFRPGGFMNWPGDQVTSDMRIRQVTLSLFKRWFGSVSTEHWHKDGFMAEAWDRRGNHVLVEQINASA